MSQCYFPDFDHYIVVTEENALISGLQEIGKQVCEDDETHQQLTLTGFGGKRAARGGKSSSYYTCNFSEGLRVFQNICVFKKK